MPERAAQLIKIVSLHNFMIRWRQALNGYVKRGDPFWKDGHAFWEGPKALADLKRREDFALVRLENSPKSDSADVTRTIIRNVIERTYFEVKTYTEKLNRVRSDAELNKSINDFFKKHARAFKQEAARVKPYSPATGAHLLEVAAYIRGELRMFNRRERLRWNHGFANPGIFENLQDQAIPVQERELDSWFQCRLATIFRLFLSRFEPLIRAQGGTLLKRHRNISLETIARLVVLFHVCADLADPFAGGIILRHNGKEVSVKNVSQNLRRARLDERIKRGRKKP